MTHNEITLYQGAVCDNRGRLIESDTVLKRIIMQYQSISRFAAAFAALILSATALAHTPLKSSIPAADSTVSGVSVIELEFNGAVRLVRLQVNQGEVELPTEFAASPEAAASYKIAAANLPAGQITVEWAAIGADGHTLTDEFSFTVNSGLAGVAGN